MLGQKILGKTSRHQKLNLKDEEYVERRENVDRIHQDDTISNLKELAIAIIKVDWKKISSNLMMVVSIFMMSAAICYIGNTAQQYYAKDLVNKSLDNVINAAKYKTVAINKHTEIVKSELSAYLSKAGKSMKDLSKSDCNIPKHLDRRAFIPLNNVCNAGKDFMLRLDASKKASEEILNTSVNNISFEDFSNSRPYNITSSYINDLDAYMQKIAPKAAKMFIMFSDDDFINLGERNNGVYSLGEIQLLYISKAPSIKGINISDFYSKDRFLFWVRSSNSILGEIIVSMILAHFILVIYSNSVKKRVAKNMENKLTSEINKLKDNINNINDDINNINDDINNVTQEIAKSEAELKGKKETLKTEFSEEKAKELSDKKVKYDLQCSRLIEYSINSMTSNETSIAKIEESLIKDSVDDIQNRYDFETPHYRELKAEIDNLESRIAGISNKSESNGLYRKLTKELAEKTKKMNILFDDKDELEEIVVRYNAMKENKKEKKRLQKQNSRLIKNRIKATQSIEDAVNAYNKFCDDRQSLKTAISTDEATIAGYRVKLSSLESKLNKKKKAFSLASRMLYDMQHSA